MKWHPGMLIYDHGFQISTRRGFVVVFTLFGIPHHKTTPNNLMISNVNE